MYKHFIFRSIMVVQVVIHDAPFLKFLDTTRSYYHFGWFCFSLTRYHLSVKNCAYHNVFFLGFSVSEALVTVGGIIFFARLPFLILNELVWLL